MSGKYNTKKGCEMSNIYELSEVKKMKDTIKNLQKENSKLNKTVELQLAITEVLKNECERLQSKCSDLECQHQIMYRD